MYMVNNLFSSTPDSEDKVEFADVNERLLNALGNVNADNVSTAVTEADDIVDNTDVTELNEDAVS